MQPIAPPVSRRRIPIIPLRLRRAQAANQLKKRRSLRETTPMMIDQLDLNQDLQRPRIKKRRRNLVLKRIKRKRKMIRKRTYSVS
jgi:hypothetical protein